MKKIDRQAVFNEVYSKWIQNPIRARMAGSCFYRLPVTGQPCFVGMLIPDDRYTHEMEGRGASDAMRMAFPELDLDPYDIAFLGELQRAHDDYYSIHATTVMLHRLAEDYNLTIPSSN